MDKRPLMVAGAVIASAAVVVVTTACWGREADGRRDSDTPAQAHADHLAPAALPPGSANAAPETLSGGNPVPVSGAMTPAATGAPAFETGRTIIAADGMSGSAPAPRTGKPVAPVDVAWILRRAPDRATAWLVSVTLTPKSQGKRLTATFAALAGGEVVRGASTIIDHPRVGQGHEAEVVVVASRATDLVLRITLQGADERSRVLSIPLPGLVPTDAAGSTSGGSAEKGPAPIQPGASTSGAAPRPGGVIQGDGVILQPSR